MSIRRRTVWRGVAIVLAGALGLSLGLVAKQALGPSQGIAYAADFMASADWTWVDGQQRGLVKINDAEVIQIRTGSGGYSPFRRAEIVAERLNAAFADGSTDPEEVAASRMNDEAVVKLGGTLIITANQEEASQHGVPVEELANGWAYGIAEALGGQPGAVVTEPVSSTAWSPEEPWDNKNVPLVSVLEGVRIGLARVSGPRSQVDLVQGVAQLETDFQRILSISVYVPISTEVPGRTISRVQGVGISALADLRL